MKTLRSDLFLVFVTLVTFVAMIPILTYIFFAKDLQSKEGIMNKNDTGVMLLDRYGKPFYTFYQAKYKSFVPLNEIPEHTKKAVIAVEDKDFYYHPGFSIKSIIRSAVSNLRQGDVVYGGSTITQQLVKNSLLHPKKDYLRKFQEIVLAQEIDRKYSKDEILEMYLNSIYFGEGAFGVGEAAKAYFDKDVADLTVAESAMLVALLPSPSSLSPFNGGLEDLERRQGIVLEKMVEQGYLTREQKLAEEERELVFNKEGNGVNKLGIHFALMVREELFNKYGGEEYVARSGFRVKTTLDPKWQQYAEEVVADQVENLEKNRVSNGAAVAIDPKSGEVKALVGSFNWHDENFGKVNVATSLRQPGSSFKPIVYVAGFADRAITPATMLKDEPKTYTIPGSTPYSPKNYDNKFRGNVLARRALANSLNVASVEVMSKVGVDKSLEMAEKLGVTSLKDVNNYGLSLVLGAGEVKLLELTSAYGVFATNGLKNEPTTILEIEDKFGSQFFAHQPKNERVLDEESAFLISSILSDSRARSEVFGNILNISRPAAVKTGTTENYRDSLTIGYTPSLVVGVWVGNNDGTPMDNIAGSLGAAPIWKALMERFLADTPYEQFNPPSSLKRLAICSNGMLLREASSSAIMEYFIPGTEPKGICSLPKIDVAKKETNEPKESKDKKPEEKKEEVPPPEGSTETIVIEIKPEEAGGPGGGNGNDKKD